VAEKPQGGVFFAGMWVAFDESIPGWYGIVLA
jgi:hypothetical protein